MSATFRKKRAARKKRFFQEGRRRIKKRLDNSPGPERPVPMMTATNIHYEYADRVRGLSAGGIGAIFLLAQRIELDQGHRPQPSLAQAASPVPRIRPRPEHRLQYPRRRPAASSTSNCGATTRFTSMPSEPSESPTRPPPGTSAAASVEADVLTLMDIFNESRLRVWAQQPPEFFEEAIMDADGSIVPSDAECKAGDGFRLRRPVRLPSALDLAGQHGRTAVLVQSQRQPPFAGAGRRLLGQSRHALPSGWLPQDPDAGRHQVLSDQASGSLGRRGRHPLHLRVRGLRFPQGQSRRIAGRVRTAF